MTILFLILSLLPLAFFSYFQVKSMRETIKDNFIATTRKEMEKTADIFNLYFEELAKNCRFLASQPAVKNADKTITSYINKTKPSELKMTPQQQGGIEAEIYNLYANFATTHKDTAYVYLGTEQGGYVQWPQGQNKAQYDPRKRPFYQKAVNNPDQVVQTTPYRAQLDDTVIISMAKTIKNQQGQVIGVQGLDVSLEGLTKMINNVSIGEEGYLILANQTGKILANPNNPQLNFQSLQELDLKKFNQPQNIEEANFFAKLNNKQFFINVYIDQETDWKFISVVPKQELTAKIHALYFKIFIITLIAVLGVILLAIYTGNKLSNPIVQATQFAQKIANNNLTISDLKINSKDEIGSLSAALNDMKNSLKKYLDEIKATYQQLEAYTEEITQLNKKLKYQAEHDSLTDLPNREKFLEELKAELAAEKVGVVMLLDLNNFKEINDTLGHIYGDQLLKELGQRLLELESETVSVARYGGDEFLFLLKASKQLEFAEKIINKLQSRFNKPFLIRNNELNMNFSVGITLYPEDAYEPNQLITNADAAMYEAKEKNNTNYLYYNHKIIEEIEERKKIRKILKTALKNDGFKLKYQPQINLETGQAEYLEALIRLKNYDLSPGKFIPVAEDSGLIVEIGRWVTAKVISHLASAHQNNFNPKKISINLSVYQLEDEGYIDFLKETLAENNVAAELIEIEITESILIKKDNKAIKFLQKLKELGVKLALDDFGTGYSSLSYLTYIPLDKIKLDKSLNDKFLEEKGLAMESLIELFHSLNLPVVAEGIETKEQYQGLKKKDCDYIQGYLFSRPVNWEQLREMAGHDFVAEIEDEEQQD